MERPLSLLLRQIAILPEEGGNFTVKRLMEGLFSINFFLVLFLLPQHIILDGVASSS